MTRILRLYAGICVIMTIAMFPGVGSSPTAFHEKPNSLPATTARYERLSRNSSVDASSCMLLMHDSGGFLSAVYNGNGSEIRPLFNTFRSCKMENVFCVVTTSESSARNTSELQLQSRKNTVWYTCITSNCTEEDVNWYFHLLHADATGVEAHCNQQKEISIGFWVTIAIVCIPALTTIVGSLLQEWLSKKRLAEYKGASDWSSETGGDHAQRKGFAQPRIFVTYPSVTSTAENQASAATEDLEHSTERVNLRSGSLSLGQQRDSEDVEVHRAHSSQTFTALTERESDKSSVSSVGGLSKSDSELSSRSPCSKESLQFSNPSVFVSPLQDDVVSSEISLIDQCDHEASRPSAIPRERETKTNTNKRFGILSILWESSIFQSVGEATRTQQQSELGSKVACLYGIQVIAVWSIIFRETTKFLSASPVVENSAMVFDEQRKTWLTAGSLHWHTFFFTNAMLDILHIRKATTPSSVYESFFGHLCRKILRQMPYVTVVVLAWTYVIPLCGEGPFWYSIRESHCTDLWWSTIIYASNFYPSTSMSQCLPWIWFMACDMQMYIVGLLFALLISKHPKVGMIGLSASIIQVTMLDLFIGYDHIPYDTDENRRNFTTWTQADDSTVGVQPSNGELMFNVLLNKPYYHWVAYATGIALCSPTKTITLLGRVSAKITISIVSAICVVGIVVLSIFSENILIDSQLAQENPLFINGMQTCWLVLLVPIVLLAINFQQGFLHRFLAAEIWRTLGKLNQCCLLTSPIILLCFTDGLDYTIRLSNLSLIVYFLALLVAVYLCSLVCFLFVQRPAELIIAGALSWIGRIRRIKHMLPEWGRRRATANNLTHGEVKPSRAESAVALPSSVFESVFTPELRTRFPSTV